MSASPPLSDSIASLVPPSDRRAPALRLEDGRWVVAGRYAIIVVREDSALADEDPADAARPMPEVVDSGMWYEVQTVRWSGEDRRLTCAWVDPARPALTGITDSDDPAEFMRVVAERVNRTMITSKQVRADNGTTITCWIRRRDDDQLISILLADGPLDEDGERLAGRFEAQVREGVGLD